MNYTEEVRKLVADVLKIPVDQLDPKVEMTEVDQWDSLRNIMILSRLEEYYGILFPEDDVFDLISVNALAEEIEKLKASNVQL